MKRIYTHTICFLLVVGLSGCELPSWLSGKSGLKQDENVDPVKAREFDSRLKQGDLTGAVNSMVEPPCATCSEVNPPSATKTHPKIHMIASVANIDCFKELARKGREVPTIKTTGASWSERSFAKTMARGINALVGDQKSQTMLAGLHIKFKDKLRSRTNGNCLPAHQLTLNTIEVARKCPDGTAIAGREGILIHEMAHAMANQMNLYPDYNRFVTRPCRVSNYSQEDSTGRKFRNRNEEFAETLSAYLTATDRLKKLCPKAYDFYAQVLFKGSNHHCPATDPL